MEMGWSGKKVIPLAMGRGSIWRRGSEGLSLQWVNTENGNAVFMCVLGLRCSRGFRQNGNTGEKQ